MDWQVTITDLVAFYAALVSTSLLVFEIVKWSKSGPQIIFEIQTNMIIYNMPNISEEKTFTVYSIVNKGNLPTTIENIGFRYYKNRFYYLIKKSSVNAIIGNTCFKPLPHVLEPGTKWQGLMDEIDATENYSKKGLFVFEADLSHLKKPIKLKKIIEIN